MLRRCDAVLLSPHRSDNGVAFGHLAPHIVGAVKDQHGFFDVLYLVDGRALGEQPAADEGFKTTVYRDAESRS